MAKRTKKSDAPETGDLLAQSPAPNAQSEPSHIPPVMLEYRPAGSDDSWRVERFDLLSAELEVYKPWAENMGLVHEALKRAPGVWLYVRRVFGVMPMIASPDTHMDDLRVWSRQELAEAQGVELKQVELQLEAARKLYDDYLTRELEGIPPSPLPSPPREGELGSVSQQAVVIFPEDILEKYAFDPRMFEVDSRDPALSRKEKGWFCQRVGEMQRMLDEPKGHSHAREALLSMLHLHRLEVDMGQRSSTSKNFQELAKLKKDFSEELSGHLEKLESLFPELGLAGKMSFRATIDALNLGLREYYGNRNRKLLDHIYTSAEVEVLHRQSVQSPRIQYRFGLAMAILEAKEHLYEPEWKSGLKMGLLKRLDAGYAAAVELVRTTSGEELVDLEAEGPKGEYPDIVALPESQAPEQTK